MPVLMVVAERRWQNTGDRVYLELAKRWAKGTAILFAVGAVSGTVLSFELGLLWPSSWSFAGPIIGMPFSLEGFAFFTEAIFLGIYLYGWDRISPRAHLCAGVVVAVSGAALGHLRRDRQRLDELADRLRPRRRPVDQHRSDRGMLNPAAFQQTLHMTLAAYAATGFAVAGIHAFLLLFDPEQRLPSPRARASRSWSARRRRCFSRSRATSAPAGRRADQPAKLAAMEAHFETERAAPRSHRRLARHGGAATRLRDRDPDGALAARVPRPRCRGEGARGVSRARTGRQCHRPRRVPGHGRLRHVPGAGLARGAAGSPGAATTTWPRPALLCRRSRWRRRWASSRSRPAGR